MPAAALVALQPRHKQRQRPTCWHQVSHLHISESVDLSSVVNIQSIVIIAIFFLSLSLSLSIMPVDLMNKKKTIDLYLYLRKKRYEVTWNGLLLKIYFHYYLDENARVGIFEIWTLLKKFRATFWCICSIYFVNFPQRYLTCWLIYCWSQPQIICISNPASGPQQWPIGFIRSQLRATLALNQSFFEIEMMWYFFFVFLKKELCWRNPQLHFPPRPNALKPFPTANSTVINYERLRVAQLTSRAIR